MTDNEKILCGNSLPLPELEEDDDRDVEKDASDEYDMLNIIDNIGTDEFKENYLISIDEIRKQSIENQRIFCTKILDKIKDIYDFIPLEKYSLNEQPQCDGIYKFIEFLEFNNLIFLSNLWHDFKIDLRKLDIKDFCNENSDRFMTLIDNQVKLNNYPQLVKEFLRTNIKEKMINFIISKTEKERMLIQLEITLKGEE